MGDMNRKSAVILTDGMLDQPFAKTAHGLIRGSERFEILAVIDSKFFGKDAGEILDGVHRGIPVYRDLKEFSCTGMHADFSIIGVAVPDGQIPKTLYEQLFESLDFGMGIVNGLHSYLSDMPDLAQIAKEKSLELIDVRKPRPAKELHHWTGAISRVSCLKIPILGTDCGIGKRTTTRLLLEAMRKAGHRAEMIFTGQTGWMQGGRYGFIFDSTLNDFVSGELEHAVVSCWEDEKPEVIFIEGQSSLRNPAGPAGAEWLLSARADGVILQHSPKRKYFGGYEDSLAEVPSLKSEVELIKMHGVEVLAVTLNTAEMTEDEIKLSRLQFQKSLNLPIICPLQEGVGSLVKLIQELIRHEN